MKSKSLIRLFLSSFYFLVITLFLFAIHPLSAFSEDVNDDRSFAQNASIPQPEAAIKATIPMADLEGEPSAFINGHVNVITGDFNDFQVDLVVPGVEPLTVERSFSRSTEKEGSLAAGWNLNLHGTLEYRHYKEDGEKRFQVFVNESHGATSLYEKTLLKKDKALEDVLIPLSRNVYRKGVTNTSAGFISGQTNIRNNKVYKVNDNAYHVFNGSRGYKEYKLSHFDSEVYFLRREVKASGNIFKYHYYQRKKHSPEQRHERPVMLQQVEVMNANNELTGVVTYPFIRRADYKKFPHQDVIAGDGRKVRYYFEMQAKHDQRSESLLTKIERTDAPMESYQYIKGVNDAGMLISRKERPDGRYMKIKYYREGNNIVGDDVVKVLKGDKKRCNRVRALQAPVGNDDTPVNIYRFFYTFERVRFPRRSKSGSTTVLDALNNKSIYHYRGDQRLEHIDKFSSDENLYSRESLYWAHHQSEQCSYLLSRSLASASGSLVFARTYTYDEHGNVLQNSLYGNLSGHNKKAPLISDVGAVTENGCECFQKQYKYSDDGFNLLLWESDGIQEVSYEYEPGSNKLTAKFIGESNQVYLREFYEYNAEAALTKKIVDDGLTKDKNNLVGVTERHITYYIPRTSYPFGYPEVIIEKYFDVASGQEIQKNKVVNTHNNQGHLVEQMHYDSDDKYLYTLYWDYNSMGKIIKEVDALQRVAEWRYDSNGNCIYEQGPNSNVHKEFTYDLADRLIRQDEIHSDGVCKSISYRYNLLNQPIAIKDYNGNETLYSYDAFGRVIQITYPPVIDETGVLASPILKKSYDLMGNVTSLIDSKGNEVKMSYTIRGQLAKRLYPDGSSESNTYRKDGLLQLSCSKNGTITSYTYDSFGRVIRTEMKSSSGELLTTTSTTYNAFHKISETNAAGLTTFYTYYPDGKLKSKQCGESRVSYTYDSIGRLKTTSEYYGPNRGDVIIKIQECDFLDRILEERVEDANGVIFTKTNYTYDMFGNVSETRSGDGNISSVTYDSHGTPTVTIDGEGNQTRVKHLFNHINSNGQCVDFKEITDALGNTTHVTCDVLGRVVSSIRKNNIGEILQKKEVTYDLNGNTCHLIDTIITGSSERIVVTKWCYDQLNRPVACHEAAGTPEQKSTWIQYNAFGQKSSYIKADGTSLHYAYDALGRLASLSSSDNTVHYVYTYDCNNNPIQVDDLIHKTTTIKKYDDNGRLIEEILGHGFTLNYHYDAMGRQTHVLLPDGTGFAYKYRGLFLERVQRLSSDAKIVYEQTYDRYDLSGRLTAATLIGKAGGASYTYDKNGRLKSIDTTCWKENLAYDPVGNLIEQRLKDSRGEIDTRYRYSDLYQLLAENGLADHDYQYDSLYNRTKKDSKIYSHNDLNQILSDGDAFYTYDLNGNLLKKVSVDKTLSFTYDALDRLISLTDQNQNVRYCYDEANRRLSKEIYHKGRSDEWVLRTMVKYLYQGQNEIGSLDSKGEIAELRLLGIGKGAEIGAAVALEIGSQIYSPVHDHAGNVVCLLEANSGKNIETYRYSAFGEELFEDALTPWRFSSKRVDEESGLVYFGRRYYDPVCGRWISQDPIGRDGGPNLYAFVLNNPLTNCDLYGLFLTPDRWKRDCGEPGFSRLFQAINAGVRYICDTWQRNCPIPIVRDAFSAAHHFCTNGNLRNYKMEYQRPHSSNGQIYGIEYYSDHRITYTPGIDNTYESTIEGAKMISRAHGDATVHFCHNKDHGILSDVLEAVAQKLNIYTHSVDKLSQLTRQLFEETGPDGKITHFGFSQGGLIVDSLRNHFSSDQLKQMRVVTYGSAKMVSQKHFGGAVNYVSFRDPMPWICDPIGIMKSFFCDDIKIIFIASKEYPGLDHAFAHESYQSEVREEGQRYMDKFIEGI